MNGRLLICATLLALMPGLAGADAVYRCPGAGGVPVFTDQPCGPQGERIAVPPPAVTGEAVPDAAPPPVTGGIDIDVNNNVVTAPAPATPASVEPRSLPFSVYRLLDRGMSQGEVLAQAGPPARETVDAVNTYDGVRNVSWYYFNRGYNDTVTRIRFENGQVVDIERTRLVGD